uniref:Hypothetical chloroplast RF1 n=1 Tax=Carteria sp. SAG 8-5 TaxID=1756294 RepID=A0A0S2LPX8_9CHLO|nr:hypothetical chloroplast RF1 [Carteria sp. SAG 8-5]
MLFFLSLVTSVKDYIEVVNKLVESDVNSISTYNDLGTLLTYFILSIKEFFGNFFSHIWSLPILIPDIASAMISEVSVLDKYFQNAFNFLETPASSSIQIDWRSEIDWQATLGNNKQNVFLYALEKFSLGFINSLFLWLPTSVSHVILLRRFVIQGLEIGYIAGLGTIAGNFIWIFSVIFGLRFFVIPWLSLDSLRYILGFFLLIKYMWDNYKEGRIVLEDLSKWKVFSLSMLLALTEQTSIYPFISNMSFGPQSSILETFSSKNLSEFVLIHGAYLSGILIGCLSLLHFMCWFWENPAFKIYMWMLSSLKISTSSYYKFINFVFLYLTMICAICSIPYYGLDYSITNPLGFVHEDRMFGIETRRPGQKPLLESSFLYTKASDRNGRGKRGRRSRAERWKKRLDKYRAFDASLYDQGIYDLFTIEDLNYGFDRFWLRRKMRQHVGKFRIALTRGLLLKFKKQVIKPSIESAKSPRIEFFRILFEQAYHPTFHEFSKKIVTNQNKTSQQKNTIIANSPLGFGSKASLYRLPEKEIQPNGNEIQKKHLINQYSTLRKFTRKLSTRINKSLVKKDTRKVENSKTLSTFLWKYNSDHSKAFNNFKYEIKTAPIEKLGAKDRNYLMLKSNVLKAIPNSDDTSLIFKNKLENQKIGRTKLLHPIKYYLEKEKSFQRKFNFYGVNLYRKFSIENNAPFFRVIMKRLFYYYKPTSRLERTLQVSKQHNIRRKGWRIPRKLIPPVAFIETSTKEKIESGERIVNTTEKEISKQALVSTNPTYSYSVLGKRASRYRSEIYRDVLQHWYYSPFNRLLLKLDVDSFISRQPKAHFLTNKEERLLHLRRFLLSEHYDTLRWYTYMQHYRTMKARIGGTKSFASRIYNQQFAGTFKKIRHLFAITPSLTDQTILKYDQPLFNEFAKPSYYHEELQTVQNKKCEVNNLDITPCLIKQYFEKSEPIKTKYIEQLLHDKNSNQLTTYIVSDSILAAQNSQPLLQEKNEDETVWKLFNKFKKHVFDKELLKKYITRKVDKNQMKKKTSEIKNKLLKERLLNFEQKKIESSKNIQSLVDFTSEDTNKKDKNNLFKNIQNFFHHDLSKKIDLKYLKKREKTEEFWKEKSTLNRTKMKTRKDLGYLYKVKMKKKKAAQQDKKLYTTQEYLMIEERQNIAGEILDMKIYNMLKQKRQERTKKILERHKKQKRQKRDEDKESENNFYYNQGPVPFYEKGLAKEFLSQPNIIKKPKILKKVNIKLHDTNEPAVLPTNSTKENEAKKRTAYVKEYWRISKKSKRMRIPKYFYVNKKLKKIKKQMKRSKAKAKLENWWWKSSIMNPSTTKENQLEEKQSLWQIEKDRTIQEKISILSNLDIIERDKNFNKNFIEKVQQETFNSQSLSNSLESITPKTFPFYAGWDESLRKFVITNRLLSRQDMSDDSFFQGLNNHTTLAWRIPFSTYDQDLYFIVGRQGFAPIKWRRIEFRHSLLQSWKKLREKLDSQNLNIFNQNPIPESTINNNRKIQLSKIRLIQKRYHRFRTLKIGQPFLGQSGQLLNEVLPTHYLYVFSKENRFDRDRYISPRMRKYSESPKKTDLQSGESRLEFTLRRRTQARRKYHKKRQTNIVGQLIPRRRKFYGEKEDLERWRPYSRERIPVKSKQKMGSTITRVRQSKRRIVRNIIKPNLRLAPYAGGFLWPGDYFRLEQIKLPKFEKDSTLKTQRKTIKRKKQTLGEYLMYQNQPKKYLIQRHNIKVIKNKLKKAQRNF